MPDVPNAGQLALVLIAILLFAAGGLISIARLKWEGSSLRIASKACLYSGVCFGIGALAWHSSRRGSWVPLEDNFETMVWIALLLAGFVAYMQRRHPLRGLDWFIMPIVIFLMVAAAVFGRTMPRQYLDTSWFRLHLVAAFGGAVAFAVAGAAGAMYLLSNWRLRTKRVAPGTGLGSLERLEHITLVSVTFGFALLTVALVTGLVRAMYGHNRMGPDWYAQPKVLLTFIAWVVYALVLHSPINPSFRGRKTALLSVVGLFLMIGILIAVQWMPSK